MSIKNIGVTKTEQILLNDLIIGFCIQKPIKVRKYLSKLYFKLLKAITSLGTTNYKILSGKKQYCFNIKGIGEVSMEAAVIQKKAPPAIIFVAKPPHSMFIIRLL